MAIFNAQNASAAQIIAQVQVALAQFRSGLAIAGSLYGWSSGVALDDLTAAPPDGPGMAQADAQDLLSAIADANGLLQLFLTGTDPRNPGAGYNYGASVRLVIGPRM
jgi:hypothetical protein